MHSLKVDVSGEVGCLRKPYPEINTLFFAFSFAFSLHQSEKVSTTKITGGKGANQPYFNVELSPNWL